MCAQVGDWSRETFHGNELWSNYCHGRIVVMVELLPERIIDMVELLLERIAVIVELLLERIAVIVKLLLERRNIAR